jgi:hypothetical protein
LFVISDLHIRAWIDSANQFTRGSGEPGAHFGLAIDVAHGSFASATPVVA